MNLTKWLLHFLTILILLGLPQNQTHPATHSTSPSTQVEEVNLTVLEGESASIYADFLDHHIPGLPPEQITYHLNQAPAHGSLLLGNNPISKGDHFSQWDVDQGQIRYRHDGSETSADQFGYTVGSSWKETRRIAVVNDNSVSPVRELIPSISADGQWAAYVSGSILTISGKTTPIPEIFLTNLQTGEIIRVNLGIHGAEPDADFFALSISRWSIHGLYISRQQSGRT